MGTIVGVVVLAWATDSVWAIPLIVHAPNTDGVVLTATPADAMSIDVDRDEHVEAWLLRPGEPARGTVVVLHGIRDRKDSMLPLGRQLVERGFQALLVDLRGHGTSTGAHLTYGVRDREDLSALLDELALHGLLVEPIGVHGTSYGAATALLFGAHDRRVDAVVSLAPFASLREVVPTYATLMFGPVGHALPDAWIQDVIDRAGEKARFDPDEACPRCAAATFHGALFLAHGSADRRIPAWHGDRIEHERGALPLERHIYAEASHGTIGWEAREDALSFLENALSVSASDRGAPRRARGLPTHP